jgi:hypothetical protein
MIEVPFSHFQNICIVWLGHCIELLDSNSFFGCENNSAGIIIMSDRNTMLYLIFIPNLFSCVTEYITQNIFPIPLIFIDT